MVTGSHGNYRWLVTDRQFDLLEICPEIVLDKYVAITSIDSGVLQLTDKNKTAGWQSNGNIGYSPKIKNATTVPSDGWSEWYIFEAPTDLGVSHLEENIFEVPHDAGHVSVFVNYCFCFA